MSSKDNSSVEQDNVAFKGQDELPSYDELAVHNGPNSRFGRWRGWIEKRAAERYADLTPEQVQQRRTRGWVLDAEPRTSPPSDSAITTKAVAAPPLHIQTSNLSIATDESTTLVPSIVTPSTRSLPFSTERISPSRLRICQFGSRFLPHATSQIRCLLPLMGDRYLLIGHDDGLSVLDMFPQEWDESGDLLNKCPSEAIARPIWVGESVQQMTLLELERAGDETLSGVVLALVGSESGDSEPHRGLRMYSLTSLISLAKWAISSRGAHPLDLYKNNHNQAHKPQTPSKKHRPQHSITKSIMQFREPQGSSQSHNLDPHHLAQKPLPPIENSPTFKGRRSQSPGVSSLCKSESSESWEFLDFEGLPQRWANDYVPLATPVTRLVGTNIQSYAIWSDEHRKGKGGQLLALATKNSILLYEAPKGERAFHFVKEFYTPLQPRVVTFFQQNVLLSQEYNQYNRGHKRSDSAGTIRATNNNSARVGQVPTVLQDYGIHLSLFVVFDKKAGWIRIADSAVGEMEIIDDLNSASTSSSHYTIGDTFKDTLSSPTNTVRRMRHSFVEFHSSERWGPPITKCDLPFEPAISLLPSQVHLITRGRQTQVVPCPLPANFSFTPLWTIRWRTPPSHVSSRLCCPEGENEGIPPFLQIIALGVGGIEVQEVPVYHLSQGKGKGKGKARVLEPSRAFEDIGGPVGFLCTGGHWDTYEQDGFPRSLSSASSLSLNSTSSTSSYESEEQLAKLKRQEGVYGWWCKDLQDWRVFWVGGTSAGNDDEDSDAEP